MAYLVFVRSGSGYVLDEREGDPPGIGTHVECDSRRFVVTKVAASPPGDPRSCVYLQPV